VLTLSEMEKDRQTLKELIAEGHNYIFIGKAGSFCPVKAGCGGGILCREKDGKFSAATGSKGYRWREGETLIGADRMDMIDMGYFQGLAQAAVEAVAKYGNFEEFAQEPPESSAAAALARKDISEKTIRVTPEQLGTAVLKMPDPDQAPWLPPCGDAKCDNCYDCPFFSPEDIPPVCRRGYDLSGYLGSVCVYGYDMGQWTADTIHEWKLKGE
jgi:hypothetical protein